MSHLKQRTESNCLNCGTEVIGRYCHQCGQENVEVKESFFHLVQHLFEDITHFDGKIWKTIKALLFRPSSLTKAYMEGKRMTYIHPIRMYLFISAVFFLVIFSFNDSSNANSAKKEIKKIDVRSQIDPKTIDSIKPQLTLGQLTLDQYTSVVNYDSIQQQLPKEKKDSWFEKILNRKQISLRERFHGNIKEIGQAVIEKLKHQFSKILYLSLPFAAFFTWLLYRKRKELFFVDHLIFAIHIYCALFTIILLNITFDAIGVFLFHLEPGFLDNYNLIISLVYVYFALKQMFGEGYIKTFFKLMLIALLNSIVLAMLATLFSIFSLLTL